MPSRDEEVSDGIPENRENLTSGDLNRQLLMSIINAANRSSGKKKQPVGSRGAQTNVLGKSPGNKPAMKRTIKQEKIKYGIQKFLSKNTEDRENLTSGNFNSPSKKRKMEHEEITTKHTSGRVKSASNSKSNLNNKVKKNAEDQKNQTEAIETPSKSKILRMFKMNSSSETPRKNRRKLKTPKKQTEAVEAPRKSKRKRKTPKKVFYYQDDTPEV